MTWPISPPQNYVTELYWHIPVLRCHVRGSKFGYVCCDVLAKCLFECDPCVRRYDTM